MVPVKAEVLQGARARMQFLQEKSTLHIGASNLSRPKSGKGGVLDGVLDTKGGVLDTHTHEMDGSPG